jgi:hypothetical protein
MLNKATTNSEVLKAKGDEEIAQYRLEEAKIGPELAKMDLDACDVKAPFSGHIARSYKESKSLTQFSNCPALFTGSSEVSGTTSRSS